MKLRRQAPAKAIIVALTAGLLAVFFQVARAQPGIEAVPASSSPLPPVDYKPFFAPNAPAATVTPVTGTPIVPVVRPHTRSRAS